MPEFATAYWPYIKPGDRLRLTGVDGFSGIYVVTGVRHENFVTMLEVLPRSKLEVLPRSNLRWVVVACITAFWLGVAASFLF